MFELTEEEWQFLRSQIVTLKVKEINIQNVCLSHVQSKA